jgi:hypothetical protein
MCPILKKLSNKLQSFDDAFQIITEILASKKGKDERVLEHLLSYADCQFGKGVTGKDYREREDGERISNFKVDLDILHEINHRLFRIYLVRSKSLTGKASNDMMFSYLERSISLLNPWLIYFDSDSNSQNIKLKNKEMDNLILQLYITEWSMADVTTERMQFDIAEGHCQRCLAYSRRLGLDEGEKIHLIAAALKNYTVLRQRQGDLPGALTFAEEGYNVVVEAYDPFHPQVQVC